MLGCRRGDGGRCFPCSALSSWPMFQPPGSAPPAEPLSSAAVVVEQLEVAALIPQRQEMPHHKHQEVEPEHVYDCLLLLLRHLGPERTLQREKKKKIIIIIKKKKGSCVLRYIVVSFSKSGVCSSRGETVSGGLTVVTVARGKQLCFRVWCCVFMVREVSESKPKTMNTLEII